MSDVLFVFRTHPYSKRHCGNVRCGTHLLYLKEYKSRTHKRGAFFLKQRRKVTSAMPHVLLLQVVVAVALMGLSARGSVVSWRWLLLQFRCCWENVTVVVTLYHSQDQHSNSSCDIAFQTSSCRRAVSFVLKSRQSFDFYLKRILA